MAKRARKSTTFFHSEKAVPLDAIDRKLLQLLQRNNRLTNLELAEKANLSPPTCMRRVKRLRDTGVIVGDVSLVDPFKVGKTLIIFVEISLERTQEPLLATFESKVHAESEIMQCYPISGDMDCLLVVMVEDMAAYHRLIRRFFVTDPNIKNFRSLFALHRTKFKTEIDLA